MGMQNKRFFKLRRYVASSIVFLSVQFLYYYVMSAKHKTSQFLSFQGQEILFDYEADKPDDWEWRITHQDNGVVSSRLRTHNGKN